METSESGKAKPKLTKDHLWGAVFVLALAGMGAVLMYALGDRGDRDTPVVESAAQGNPAETPNPTASPAAN